MNQIKIFKNDKFNLKPMQMKAIELLVNCKLNREEIAKECNVNPKTLYNWIHHDEVFREAMDWYRRELYREHAPTAVKTIVELMDEAENENVRLAAAREILSMVGDDAEKKFELSTDKDKEFKIIVDVMGAGEKNA